MGRATSAMTPEQEELLDSGLRMLAHMIAETHLRRIALKKKQFASQSPEATNETEPQKLEKSTEDRDE